MADNTTKETIKLPWTPFSSDYLPSSCEKLPPHQYTFPRKFYLIGPKSRELTIFRWTYLTYSTVLKISWKLVSKDFCPYPSELLPFFQKIFNRYARRGVPDLSEWPVGYAPCWFWSVQPEDWGTVQMIIRISLKWMIHHIMKLKCPRVSQGRKKSDVLVAWMAGNCNPKNNRSDYVRELMKYITVHSFGICLHNQELPDDIREKYNIKKGETAYFREHTYEVKIDVFMRYKFVLAFENSNCESYVTEKVYDSLKSHTIPIYMGASDIDDFVPPNSIIKVTDFKMSKTSLIIFIKLLIIKHYMKVISNGKMIKLIRISV
ncbi:11053_t:CDS:2, partial [Scutellospora calospora]